MQEIPLHERIKKNADDLSRALEHTMRQLFSPDETKKLRSFSANEVTELLGVAPGYLRKAYHDGRLPQMDPGPSGKRVYSAEDIWEIRQVLGGKARYPYQILPGRREGDKLQVWSIANFKGGSGKTSSAVHIAQRLALKGYRVLAIDSDPQASLTTFFGFRPEVDFYGDDSSTLYDAIRYKESDGSGGPVPLSAVRRKTYFPNLDLVPGGLMLSEFEHETPQALSRMEQPIFFQRLARAIEEIEAEYDIVVIDCPPQLGYVTLSALCASTSIIMTMIPDRIDIASAAQFLRMASSLLEVMSESGGITSYDYMRFLITRYDTNISTQMMLNGYLREIFGEQVMKTEFLKSSEVSSAGLSQKTIYEISPKDTNRRTLARVLESVNAICDEIHDMIQAAWGRNP